jgi:predicted AlkP superfamily phosphohydrolase/phosphomutase
VARMREALEQLTDPATGQRAVARVRTAREAYAGDRIAQAPDLVVTFAPGFAGSLDSMLGGMAAHAVSPNEGRWTAEHATVDERSVPGVWLSSMPLAGETMSVLDVAPTVLQYFGAAATSVIEGRGQLRDRPTSTSRR